MSTRSSGSCSSLLSSKLEVVSFVKVAILSGNARSLQDLRENNVSDANSGGTTF